MNRKRHKKDCVKNLPLAIFLLVFAVICILPFWLVLAGSLSSEAEIMSKGFQLISEKIDFTAYRILMTNSGRILKGYQISLTVTVIGTALTVLVVSMAAWPISQERVKYHRFLNFFVLFTMLFNGGMVPWFIVCRNILHLTDTIWALILPYVANAWYIFLVRNYYKGIPQELVEAAKMDGAGEYRIFFRIIFPLAKPVIATISLFACLAYWNDWWLGIMLIDDVDKQPLQLLLRTITSNIQFLSSAGNVNAVAQAAGSIPSEGIKMATCIVTIGPIILVYPFVQKYFVKGIMVGAVKG